MKQKIPIQAVGQNGRSDVQQIPFSPRSRTHITDVPSEFSFQITLLFGTFFYKPPR